MECEGDYFKKMEGAGWPVKGTWTSLSRGYISRQNYLALLEKSVILIAMEHIAK